jgi:hypothetical protein
MYLYQCITIDQGIVSCKFKETIQTLAKEPRHEVFASNAVTAIQSEWILSLPILKIEKPLTLDI